MQTRKDITMQILEDQGTLSFFDLLNAINQNKINIHGLTVIDNNNYIWQFNVEENSFKEINRNIRLSEVYPDGVLINLTFRQVIIKEKTSKAKQAVIAYLENQYKDLDMSIDACQGCMEGLDDAFEELAIYKHILATLGVDLNDNKTSERITAEWFQRQKEKEALIQSKMNCLFEPIKPGIDLIISDDNRDKTLLEVLTKVNSILNYLKENQ